MGHLLKLKCVDSRMNVPILASTSVPFRYTHDGASAKFSTNSQGTDYSVGFCLGWSSSFVGSESCQIQSVPTEYGLRQNSIPPPPPPSLYFDTWKRGEVDQREG
jgi:hypothetical protein